MKDLKHQEFSLAVQKRKETLRYQRQLRRKEYTKKIICEMFRDIFREKEREIKIKSKRKLYLSKELITTKPECPRDYLLN